jgi:hypothetical protein
MKKMFFAVLTALIAFSFIACDKTEKTTEEYLTQTKGWTLTAGTCDPAYELWSGGKITNLFDGFIQACELDDIIYFQENKSQVLNFGKVRCDWDPDGKEVSLGNWNLIDNSHLKFYFPAYEEPLEAVILKIDDETLKLQFNFDEDDGEEPAKFSRGPKDPKTVRNYTFTLTYSKK